MSSAYPERVKLCSSWHHSPQIGFRKAEKEKKNAKDLVNTKNTLNFAAL
jgi:hypothetical protein